MTVTSAVRSWPGFFDASRATFVREWISHRLNRFLYAHLLLTLIAGNLVLLTPGRALATGATMWILYAVLYAISLSAMLLGLSSAQAEAEEFPFLLTQPVGVGPIVAGKSVALLQIVILSSALLVVPALLAGGWSWPLIAVAAGAAGVTAVCAMLGLAVGFWVRDGVRGLIVTVGLWLALLFGTDLLLLAVAGAPRVQEHPDLWVAPLMLNPFDAFRVTVLFSVERVAFAGFSAGTVPGWWVRNAGWWLAALFTGWTALAATAVLYGMRRRTDG